MKKFIVVFLYFLMLTNLVFAQFGSNQWEKNRHEIFFGAGASYFIGDFCNNSVNGVPSLKDFDVSSTRFAIQGGYSYKLIEHLSLGVALSHVQIYGADKSESGRNLHFKSPVIELSALLSFYILTEKHSQRYNVGARGSGSKTPSWYIYTGISGIYFDPQAKHANGRWHHLQPLGTEGQGIIETRNKYSRVTIAIPIGTGLIFPVNKQWGIGGEIGVRYTFSDYLDDISSTYIDPNLFTDPLARYFHNPTASQGQGDAWEGSGIGKARGNNRFNDMYLFVMLKVTYKITKSNKYRF
jgi:hypothetical protein